LSASFMAAEPKLEPQPNKQQSDVEMAVPPLAVEEKQAAPATEKRPAAESDAAAPKVQQAPGEAPPLQPSLGALDAPVVMSDVIALPSAASVVAADVTPAEARDGRTTAELKEEQLLTAGVSASESSDTPMRLDDGAAAPPPPASAQEQQPVAQRGDVEMTVAPSPVEEKRVDPAPAVQEAPKLPPPAPVVSAPPVRKRRRYFVPEDRERTPSPPVPISTPVAAANAISVAAHVPAPVAVPASTTIIAAGPDPAAPAAPAANVTVVPQELLQAPSHSPAAAVVGVEPDAKMPAMKEAAMPLSDEVVAAAAVAPEVSHAADLQQDDGTLRPPRRVSVAPTVEFFDVYDVLQDMLAPLWEPLVTARVLTRDQTALAHWIEPVKVNKLLYAKYRHIMSGAKTNNTNGQFQSNTLACASHEVCVELMRPMLLLRFPDF
jgi:hypothetical protein